MTQVNRLAQGGRVDRSARLDFTFDGRACEGYRGDTLASALLANDVHLVARSFKYRRPRGIVGAGAEEPNAILQVGDGAHTIPNLRATQTELYPGLAASSVNGWPGLRFDLTAAAGALGALLPPGFYYKTFMAPAKLWPLYERALRRAAGLGRCPVEPDPDVYDTLNHHCDVLVVGAGPAGIAAALEAARTGARVMLVDEQQEPGGSLLGTRRQIDGGPGAQWLEAVLAELSAFPELELLPRTTAFGYYDHNLVAALERRADHLGPAAPAGARQRLHRIRARQVVLATGAIERPPVFANNDRPGVMLASAVATYVNRYAVAPGRRAVVFTANDEAYRTALDLLDAGREVAAVVDSRPAPDGRLPRSLRERGVDVLAGHGVIDVKGGRRVRRVLVAPLSAGGRKPAGAAFGVDCDLLAVSGGWSPAIHLHSHTGARPVWDAEKACFLPGGPSARHRSAGACNGEYRLGGCLAEGAVAGARAAERAGWGEGRPARRDFDTGDESQAPAGALFFVPHRKPVDRAPGQFVDFQLDVTAAAIGIAAREGYRSAEHLKRYTAAGFGTDQGKLGNINAIAILADTLGRSIADTGTTVFRPPYTPATFGALAGRATGELFEPVRRTPMHRWHEAQGAVWEDVGQWKRPRYYPRPGETMREAVSRECLAVRNGVGMLDASTLGKIDIQGPDAAEFLNRIYTNAWLKLAPGKCRYGLMLDDEGMVFDDGVTACLAENRYLMHTTTGNAAAVLAWLELWQQTEWPELEVYFTSVTDHWATVTVSGPQARAVIAAVCDDVDLSREAFGYMDWRAGTVAGVAARLFRISFTGELSFEINVQANHGRRVWEAVREAGAAFGITPYGTETMHVLRAEKGYVIVGQDTDGSVTPADLGMDWVIGKRKDFGFVGKRSLHRRDCLRAGRRHLVGLETVDPAVVIPEGAQVVDDPAAAIPMPMRGHVTSSYHSAGLGRSIALALIEDGRKRIGHTVHCPLAGGRSIAAVIVRPGFYDPEGERQNV